MFYAAISDNEIIEYPLSERDIKERFPNTSWVVGQFTPPEGYVKVAHVNAPVPAFDEDMREGSPVYKDGQWVQSWTLVKVSEAEKEARTKAAGIAQNERVRQALLECDWTQLADAAGICDQQAWAHYRQQLRDVSKQDGFPFAIKWPASPK